MESVDILLYRAMEGSLLRALDQQGSGRVDGRVTSILTYIASRVAPQVSSRIRKGLR